MDQIHTTNAANNDQGHDVPIDNVRQLKDLRTLSDFEMVYVGGGDGGVGWP